MAEYWPQPTIITMNVNACVNMYVSLVKTERIEVYIFNCRYADHPCFLSLLASTFHNHLWYTRRMWTCHSRYVHGFCYIRLAFARNAHTHTYTCTWLPATRTHVLRIPNFPHWLVAFVVISSTSPCTIFPFVKRKHQYFCDQVLILVFFSRSVVVPGWKL